MSSQDAAAAGNAGDKKPGGPDWARIRNEFPTTERFVYLDIARKAILPRVVEETMRDWIQDVYDTAGAGAFSADATESTRRAVAETFGAPATGIALIKNTSEGINIVAQGFPWKAGDNVVISEAEHENNTFPWRHLARRGVEVRFAAPAEDGRVTLDCYRELIDDRTRIVSCAWVTYGNGYRADLKALSAFCKERNIRLVVDGIQAVGVLSDRIEDLGVDVLVAGGHKAQFSLAGAGFMYADRAMIEMLTPPYAAKFSFTSNDRFQKAPTLAPDAHRFEYGNPNFVGLWVQRRSADFINKIGLSHIEARVRELSTALIERAEQSQIRVRTPKRWEDRAGIVSFDVGPETSRIVTELRKKSVIVSAKDNHLRAAVHFYNTEEDVDRFLEALRKC
jgi:selenocysteine lyase/cysteine desulfurase